MKVFGSPLSVLVASALLLLSQEVTALNVRTYGMNYNSRKGPDYAPIEQRCKTASEIQKDMETIKTISDRVRLYSLVDCDQAKDVLPAAKRVGLKVALGIWTTADHGQLLVEKNKLNELVDAGLIDENVVGLHVGSEAIYREEITAETAIAYMNEIRDFLHEKGVSHIPISIADVVDVYYQNPQLLDAVDIVSVNQFSFWEDKFVNEGVARMLDRLSDLFKQAALKGKQVIISETGWSSNGQAQGASEATPYNQAKFFHDFYQMALAHGLKYYWFAAFDSRWRAQNGDHEVEANFGIFTEQNVLKENFKNLIIKPYKPMQIFKMIEKQKQVVFLSSLQNEIQASTEADDVNGHHIWFFDPETQLIRSMSSDRCLDAFEPRNGGKVHVYTCMGWEKNQKWQFNEQKQRLEHLTHQGFCLDMDPNLGNKIHLWECMDGNENQKWQVAPASRLASVSSVDFPSFFNHTSSQVHAPSLTEDEENSSSSNSSSTDDSLASGSFTSSEEEEEEQEPVEDLAALRWSKQKSSNSTST